MTCFWGHKWPKWSAPRTQQMVERGSYDEPWKPRNITIQDRTCEACGQYEVRRVVIKV